MNFFKKVCRPSGNDIYRMKYVINTYEDANYINFVAKNTYMFDSTFPAAYQN